MDKGGGWNIRKRGGGTSPYSLNSFIFRCLPLLFGFHNDDTEKSKKTIAPPPETGFPAVPCSGAMRHALHRPPGGRYRRYLSLREGSEHPPFPLALHRVGSVLAVKGSLRRFAPWTAPVRSERRAAYEGKGGVRIRPPAYQPRKAGGFLVSDSSRSLPNGTDRPRTSIEEAPMVAPHFSINRRSATQLFPLYHARAYCPKLLILFHLRPRTCVI